MTTKKSLIDFNESDLSSQLVDLITNDKPAFDRYASELKDILIPPNLIAYSDNPKPTEGVISFEDSDGDLQPLIAEGNIHLIQGKPKTGKSLYLAYLVKVAMGEPSKHYKAKKGARVCVFDSEQGISSCQWALKRMTYKGNYPTYITTVSMTRDQKLAALWVMANENDMLIIDNAAHFVSDFNNPEICEQFVDALKQIKRTTSTSIVCVIHENKGSESPKGHLGSLLQQVAFLVARVTREGSNHTFSPVLCREAEPNTLDFGYNFKTNEWIWTSTNLIGEKKTTIESYADSELYSMVERAIGNKALNKTALKEAISQESYNLGNGTIGRKVFENHFLPEIIRREIVINEKAEEGKYSFVINSKFYSN